MCTGSAKPRDSISRWARLHGPQNLTEVHFLSVLFLQRTQNFSLPQGKCQANPSGGKSYKYLTSALQNYQGHQDQAKSEKLTEKSEPRRYDPPERLQMRP